MKRNAALVLIIMVYCVFGPPLAMVADWGMGWVKAWLRYGYDFSHKPSPWMRLKHDSEALAVFYGFGIAPAFFSGWYLASCVVDRVQMNIYAYFLIGIGVAMTYSLLVAFLIPRIIPFAAVSALFSSAVLFLVIKVLLYKTRYRLIAVTHFPSEA